MCDGRRKDAGVKEGGKKRENETQMANELKSAILCFIAISCLSFSAIAISVQFPPSPNMPHSILRLPFGAARASCHNGGTVLAFATVCHKSDGSVLGVDARECIARYVDGWMYGCECVATDSDTAICHATATAMAIELALGH